MSTVIHRYKCKQCDLIVEGEAAGMAHEKDTLFTHSMGFYLPKEFENHKPSEEPAAPNLTNPTEKGEE